MKERNVQLIMALMLVAVLSTAAIWLAGCKKKSQSTEQQTTQVETSKPAEAVAVEQKTCPVMGGAINKEIYVEYKGKKVYFCCPSCKEKFQQAPEKYISKLPQFSKK